MKRGAETYSAAAGARSRNNDRSLIVASSG